MIWKQSCTCTRCYTGEHCSRDKLPRMLFSRYIQNKNSSPVFSLGWSYTKWVHLKEQSFCQYMKQLRFEPNNLSSSQLSLLRSDWLQRFNCVRRRRMPTNLAVVHGLKLDAILIWAIFIWLADYHNSLDFMHDREWLVLKTNTCSTLPADLLCVIFVANFFTV